MSAKVIRFCEVDHRRVIHYTDQCPVCEVLTVADACHTELHGEIQDLKDQVSSYELEIQEYRAAQSVN